VTLVQVDPSGLDIAGDPDGTVVTWCERGSAAIEQAASIADARDIRDWADTIEHASKVRDLNHETIVVASALKIRAERRIGQLIADGQERGEIAKRGDAGRGRQMSSGTTSIGELGLSRDEASQAKRLAEPDDDEFERAVSEATEEAREKAGISRRSVLSKIERREQNEAEAAEQREWVDSLGEDPDPDLTARRQQAQFALIGMNRGVRKLTDGFTPTEVSDLLATSFPHVRDRHIADIVHAAETLAAYREALS
jgi:secreted protein with Ig-like and vWFA domain